MLAEKDTTGVSVSPRHGFCLFQDFFFRRPEVVAAREVPANKMHYLRLLDMVCREKLDMRELGRLIKQEPAICYRLLRPASYRS